MLTHSRFGKAEAAFDDRGPEDDEVKVENSNGGVPSAGIGAAIGDLARTVGHAAATVVSIATGVDINWPASNYTSDNTNGSSTTVERPFNVSYKAARDTTSNVWRLRVDSITGGANIHVRTGGSRDPVANPPTTEAQAQDAVTVMKGYYSRGSRGSWHTEAASKAHEEHHYQEWQCSGNHYWPTARTAVQSLSVPLSSHPDEAAAITAMRAGASGADAIIQSFRDVAHRYWFTLEDNASSRPYAAGQLVLNNAVRHVQTLATGKGWTVPGGVDTPSAANPCYQPWLPYSP